ARCTRNREPTHKTSLHSLEQLFNLLNMSSARRHQDLTAQARIRDAAVRRFAIDGLAAPLRAIAADADVSPALILHHFGSREGLRAACDEYVIEEIFAADQELLSAPDPATALAW